MGLMLKSVEALIGHNGVKSVENRHSWVEIRASIMGLTGLRAFRRPFTCSRAATSAAAQGLKSLRV